MKSENKILASKILNSTFHYQANEMVGKTPIPNIDSEMARAGAAIIT
jgi:hypothetical protein